MNIAIVGMAFRFPGGVYSGKDFWDVLKKGRDVVGTISEDRWSTDIYYHPRPAEPGKSLTLSAGLLDRVDGFDAAFFGISPREARKMDPQHRLVLELTWEALENGGHLPKQLAGSDCGVYLGISSNDYGLRSADDASTVDAYYMTGNTLSIAANRISYAFDLRGPSMALDTACSSSLVALHQACRSLQNGESSLAIAGGVNLLLHPNPFVGFSSASMLSPRGKCHAFDASADGYVRAEGGAILLLKPLQQAQADGDTIEAVILATGANSDGADKSGITIPSAAGQASLLRSTLKRAGLVPDDITYVEAHGTGTAVGDPVEAAAIGEVLGVTRTDKTPLYIGSVKTNIGHLEPASGMAGLVKTVLSLKHRSLPPSLNLDTPNPDIDMQGLNLRPVTDLLELPEAAKPLCMGVNSFGFGGANAHVLLQEYRDTRPSAPNRDSADTPPLFLSAKTPEALKALAKSFVDRVQGSVGSEYYDIAYSAASHRQWLDVRFAAWGEDAGEVVRALQQFSSDEPANNFVSEHALAAPASVAFVFSGNGSQWAGMGRQLLDEDPLFRSTVDEIETLLGDRVSFSLLEALQGDAESAQLHLTEVAQPALFALQVGVTRILRSHGLDAQFAVGHSVGEITAAWAVGALSLEQAVTVILERSAAQGVTRGSGRMAAVGLSQQQVQKVLAGAGLDEAIEVAGLNSPTSVTLSGDLPSLELLREQLEPEGIFYRLLDLDYAFHSRRMEPIRQRLLDSLEGLKPMAGSGQFVSTVTGDVLAGGKLDARYWWENIRKPVRFSQAMKTLANNGCSVFLEIGPHAIMQRYIGECLDQQASVGRALPTLKRDEAGPELLLQAAHRCWLLGAPLPTQHWFPQAGHFVPLPNYPWQRERHWNTPSVESCDLIHRTRVHPLLGYRLKDGQATWENHLDHYQCAYLADHIVSGAMVLPGTAYLEMALAASAAWNGGEIHEVEDLEILAPIVFDAEHAQTVRFELAPEDGRFQIFARQRLGEDPWILHATGRLLGAPLANRPAQLTSNEWLPEGEADTSAEQHYVMARRLGLEFGPSFQGVDKAWLREESGQLVARIRTPAPVKDELGDYLLHPVLLDSCFQTLLDVFREKIEAGDHTTLLPVHVGRMRLYQAGTEVAWVRTRVIRQSPHSVLAEFWLLDEQGNTLATLEGCRFRGTRLVHDEVPVPELWHYVPFVAPRLGGDCLSPIPPTNDLIRTAESLLTELEPKLGRHAHFQQVVPLLDALVSSFAFRAVRQLQENHADSLGEALDAVLLNPRLRQYASWLFGVLEEDGLLMQRDAGWMIAEQAELPDPEDIWLTLVGDYPACLPDIVLAGRVGRNLAGLLGGCVDADEFSASLAGSNLQEQLYDASPTYLGINRAALEIVRKVASACPANRRLRILEIAGSAWDFTRQVLPHLPVGRSDYFIADIDEAIFERRQAEYAGHTFISTLQLDLDSVTLSMDDVPQFDLVIANQNLHLAQDVHQVLDGIKAMLAPGGLLLMLERYPDRSADFVDGLRAGWWGGIEEHGGVSSRQVPATWTGLLETAGFAEVETLQEPESGQMTSGAFALLAIRPDPSFESKSDPEKSACWLLLADGEGESRALASSLQRRLQLRGQQTFIAVPGGSLEVIDSGLVTADLDSVDGVQSLLEYLQNELGACDHVIQLMGIESGEEVPDLDPLDVQERRCVSTLHLVQATLSVNQSQLPKLWLVTSGAAVFDQAEAYEGLGRIRPSQAPLLGFGRVIMNEYPDLDCTLVDLQTGHLDAVVADWLMAEFMEPDGEDEIFISEHARYGARMQRLPGLETHAVTGNDVHLQLGFDVPGQLKNLQWQVTQAPLLAADDIEIQPRAVGLNFRDVMYTMGLLSDEAVENGFAGPTLGLEVAGVVTRTGIDVTGFAPGDSVVAFAPACFSSRVVTKAGSAVAKPQAWSFEEAATVPTVFFTVYYALHHLAQLQPGEKVLIHGGAGGIGIAAIQLARYLGAEVFATAGSEEKRDFVRLLGADHVMNSRDLAFADEILSITDGQGIDVVLNSLAGEAINRNLRVLRPFGRFLELGKRDFYENTRIGLRPFKDNITYYGIDADQLMVEKPALATRLFREVMSLIEEGVLRPLPYRSYPAVRVADAFRYMQQSRQIGKIVITFDEMPTVQEPVLAAPPALLSDATYLVTGGIDGFGLKTARWLAELGAGNLVLLGRRGKQTPGAAKARQELEALGARVHIRACDVTDRESLAGVLADIRQGLPALRGVFHCAMVLRDATVANLDRQDFMAVMGPKIQGARYLHQLTLGLPLDWFVLYSSATTFIGNPGQANYVAANMYLESLANYRRSLGLAATSVSWGAIADVGYLSRNESVKDSLQSRLGTEALDSDAALAQLGQMMATGASGLAVMDFNWPALSRFLPAAGSARFDTLRRSEVGSTLDTGQGDDIQALIAGCSDDEVVAIVKQLITEEVAVIMRIPADRLDTNRSMYDMGMDSLMGVELVVGLEKRLGVSVPVMALAQGPTIERIAATLSRQLTGTGPEQEDDDDAELRGLVLSTASQHGEDISEERMAAIVRDMQQ